MDSQLILHNPHSSIFIPYREGYLLPESDIEAELKALTDWYTDDIFDSASDIKIVAPFSRIFCDVERFKEDNLEIMAEFGMGVLYEKMDDGRLLRSGKSLIIDCHSFPDIPIKRDLNQEKGRPDFCFGTDDFHTPSWLRDLTLNFFSQKGYSIMENKPYEGSIVPLSHYRINRNVISVMIEINRKLYLGEGSAKSDGYGKVKELIVDYLNIIRNVTE